MVLIRSKNNRLTLPVEFIIDRKLSYSAKGLLAYLLSISGDTEVCLKGLPQEVIEELKYHGYIYQEDDSDTLIVRGER